MYQRESFPLLRFPVLILIAALCWSGAAAWAAAPGPGPQIGTNLGFLNDNAGEWPFVDVFKTSSGWYSAGICGWNCGTLDLDDNGWVRSLQTGQMATALIFTQVPDMMPHAHVDHEYHVFYDGTGVLDYDGSVTSVVQQAPGHDVVKVDPASDQAFAITIILTAKTWDSSVQVPASDYIRNIRVIAPGGVCSNDLYTSCQDNSGCTTGTCDLFADNSNYLAQRFHPDFLRNVREFGVIRLMDWIGINDSQGTTVSYDDYTEVDSARWNLAPVEVMVDLANRLDVDIWVNIPHMADDSMITGLATGLAAELDDDLKVYVEYSNEIWNSEYPQYQFMAEVGCAGYPDLVDACDDDDSGGDNNILCEGHANNPVPECDTARIRYTSDRSRHAWQLFYDAFDAPGVFGTGATRVVRVLASHSGNTDLHRALLSWQNTYQSVDAFATGAYFGWPLGGDPIVQTWDPANTAHMDALFARLSTEVNDTLGDMGLDRQFLLTDSTGIFNSIPLVFYEGGQGLVVWGANSATEQARNHANAVFDAANKDDDMAVLYEQLLDGWRQVGGDTLFNHYVNCRRYTGWDRYGTLEHQRQIGP